MIDLAPVVPCPEGCTCISARHVAHDPDRIRMWVITHRTSDFGELYVTRLHEIGGGEVRVHRRALIEARTLAEARTKVPDGLELVPTSPADDPVIVESWW